MIGFTILIVICVLTVLGLLGLYIYGFYTTLKSKDYPMFFFLLGGFLVLVMTYLGYYLYSLGV